RATSAASPRTGRPCRSSRSAPAPGRRRAVTRRPAPTPPSERSTAARSRRRDARRPRAASPSAPAWRRRRSWQRLRRAAARAARPRTGRSGRSGCCRSEVGAVGRRLTSRAPRSFRLYRALALSTYHLEGDVAVPVDEVVHRLQAELDRQRELLDEPFELRGTDALDERDPLLAVLARGLVVAQPALHRVGDALRRQTQLQALAEPDVA